MNKIANQTMKPMWQPSLNKWHDQAGMAHITFGQKGPACGARPYALGGAFATPGETGSPTCRRCKRIEDSHAQRNAAKRPRKAVRDQIPEARADELDAPGLRSG